MLFDCDRDSKILAWVDNKRGGGGESRVGGGGEEKKEEEEEEAHQSLRKKEMKREFPPVARCETRGRSEHAVAADLDGTLLVSRSSFPYFMLVAVEAGGILRGVLLLLASPLVLFLYRLVSEAAGIQLLIFVSLAGLRLSDIELAARTVLPRFYAADVRADSWRAFRACGRRRVVVTANPTVMVEPFVKGWLGGHGVLGTRLQVDPWTGRATGLVQAPGVLVGDRKRQAVASEFAAEAMPELGLGDRASDHDFMALCKEGFMVPADPSAARVPSEELAGPAVFFHDGRLLRRPEPRTALLTFLWLSLALPLSLLRLLLTSLPLPPHLLCRCFRLFRIDLAVRGTPPLPPAPGSPGSLLVCNHRTALDAAVVSAALGRRVSRAVTCGPSRPLSEILSPVPAVRLTRDRAADAARVSTLLEEGEVVFFPEETTCREPFLLQFSPLFAELSDRIVPVAIDTRQGMFHGTTVRGHRFLDNLFFFMNPRPGYEITFLERLPTEWTCGGGRPAAKVAGHVQELVAKELGFENTALTRKDKYSPSAKESSEPKKTS
ncbi:hypothetical protein Taro_011203 [Colocasia esculenta]|uniref:Phospholipid/glycerol acyltransferase domain-containing protein n=1 Tax=Colocasia esculenta TaxID=4460 RepID=A0A843U9Y0_COLES|nr:hypothetical protein [Colocasia esculenta]